RFMGIPQEAFVAGYVGRLAPEKNLPFLAEAIRKYVARRKNAQFLVVGSGPSEDVIREIFDQGELSSRLHLTGSLDGQDLVDAYHAMDVFVFASYTETQGMVVTEALAACRPVVALDAPGVREVIKDGYNGRLLKHRDVSDFTAAIAQLASISPRRRDKLRQAASETAQRFSMDRCARKLLDVYRHVLKQQPPGPRDESVWHQASEEVKAEWELLKNMAEAVTRALK
ncbi:MAG: glycosyltransferase, partial [Planctomycetaceae bacterium]